MFDMSNNMSNNENATHIKMIDVYDEREIAYVICESFDAFSTNNHCITYIIRRQSGMLVISRMHYIDDITYRYNSYLIINPNLRFNVSLVLPWIKLSYTNRLNHACYLFLVYLYPEVVVFYLNMIDH